MTNDPFTESARVIEATGTECRDAIERAATLCIDAIRRGGKLMICGNGGSMAEACHMAAELVVRLRSDNDRRALPAVALGTNPAVMTACGNDYGYDEVFAREVEAIGNEGDVLICLTTSGTSPNVVRAVQSLVGIPFVAIIGDHAEYHDSVLDYREEGDEIIVVPSRDTARIQEATLVVIHELCRLIEEGVCDE